MIKFFVDPVSNHLRLALTSDSMATPMGCGASYVGESLVPLPARIGCSSCNWTVPSGRTTQPNTG